jgi:hypothetical protein
MYYHQCLDHLEKRRNYAQFPFHELSPIIVVLVTPVQALSPSHEGGAVSSSNLDRSLGRPLGLSVGIVLGYTEGTDEGQIEVFTEAHGGRRGKGRVVGNKLGSSL